MVTWPPVVAHIRVGGSQRGSQDRPATAHLEIGHSTDLTAACLSATLELNSCSRDRVYRLARTTGDGGDDSERVRLDSWGRRLLS